MDPKIGSYFSKDSIIKELYDKYPLEEITPTENLFRDIIESIISQQLSVKVSNVIFRRLSELIDGKFLPEKILDQTNENLRSIGISYRKASYLKSLATEVSSDQAGFSDLINKTDEEVIKFLTRVKGIRRWTAEMILIFSFGRPDVFSLGDLGLRTAISKLYSVDREDHKAIDQISQRWSPYRSTVSRLLWRSLDNQ